MKDYEGRKVDFDKMNNARKRNLYKAMWGEVDGFSIEKTGDSALQDNTDEKYKPASSYRLRGIGEPDKILINQFQIGDENQFLKKYKMAIAGDGQEESRITTLHSSSLCALLHFYNVTKDNSLTLTINGREIKFTDAVFEFKSPVIGNPSNMDVVLIGDDEKVVLFLECKFAEYYLGVGKTYKCSKAYKKYFIEYLNMKKPNYTWKDICMGVEEDCIKLETKQSVYLTGIKQMVAHHIGISNVLTGNTISDKKEPGKQNKINDLCSNENCEIYLGEIIFDFAEAFKRRDAEKNAALKNKEAEKSKETKKYEEWKNRYTEKYEGLAKRLNSICEKIHVLDNLLTYNEIFNNKENPYDFPLRVKAFYYGKE